MQGFCDTAFQRREAARRRRDEERQKRGEPPSRRRALSIPIFVAFLVNLLVMTCLRGLEGPFLSRLTHLGSLPAKARIFRRFLSLLGVLCHGVRTHQLRRRAAAANAQYVVPCNPVMPSYICTYILTYSTTTINRSRTDIIDTTNHQHVYVKR